jgi:heme A synthase
MIARRLSYALVALTFALVLLGGVVHSTGSSLACPDWPLCYGMVFPPMRGGILYEHGHRLLASGVALCTLALALAVWPRRDTPLRLLAALGVVLVLFQACLGGLTVILRLPPPVSITHLATSMAFFAWALLMLFRLQMPVGSQPDGTALVSRRYVAWAAGLIYLQIIVGAAVRHTAASMSCGPEMLTCLGDWLPTTGPQWLQTSHRVLALVVMAAVVAATVGPMRAARRAGRRVAYRFGLATHILVLLQVAMGLLTLRTGVQMHVVTTHLALGAALWGAMVAFWLQLGPIGAPAALQGTPPLGVAVG